MADEFGDDGVQTFDASTGQYALSETVHGSESDLLMHQLNEFMEAEKEKIIDAFREFDVDSNGALDFGEMCAMANSLRITVPIAHLRYLFDKIDEHRSGMVDILELEHYVRRWRRRIGSHRRDDTGGGTSPTAKPGKWFKERVGPNAGDVAFSWHINPAAAKEQREQQERQKRQQQRQQERQQQQERPETGDTDGGLGGSGARTGASTGASGGRGKPGEMRGSASHGALRGSAKGNRGNRGALGRSSTSALSPLSASLSASSSVLPGDSGSKGVRGRIGEAREMDRSVSNGRKEERKEGRKASAASNASKGAGGNTGGNTGGKTGGRKASSMATTTAANAATTTFGNNDGDGDSDSDSSGYDDSDSMDEVDAEEAAAAAAAAAKAKTLEEELGAENAVRATELQSYRATELKGSTLVYIFSVAWRDLHVYFNTEKCEVFHL